ncbi:MAG: GTPase [Planctomycetota bacterium]
MSLSEDIFQLERRLQKFEAQLESRYPDRIRRLALASRRAGVPEDLLTVGLVGGTGVGKSSLINALAGREISATSSRRPTTDRIIPYLHRDRMSAVDHMDSIVKNLSRERAVHDVEGLRYLALFDLPDIDSSAEKNATVVREALQSLDLVVWVTSITKFADRVFHDWIGEQSSGMNLANFVFVLNKVDEIADPDPQAAARQLHENFRSSVMESLGAGGLSAEPRFFLVSAAPRAERSAADQFEAFRDFLLTERDQREVAKIKSSNRGAELESRHQHLVEALAFDERLEWIDGDSTFTEERVLAELDREDVQDALQKVLRESPVQAAMARDDFRASLASWPILPQLGFLLAPFRGIPKLLQQIALLARLEGTGESALKKRRDPLFEAMRRIEDDRRRRRSRIKDPRLEAVLSNKNDAAIETHRTRLQNECDAKLDEALAEKRPDSRSQRKPKKGFVKSVLIWLPLIWFPLLQPLLQTILNPEHDLSTLPLRLVHRLVRITGATHLLVSLLFVVVLYAAYVLILRALSWARAARECRKLLETDWWTTTLRERFHAVLTSENKSLRSSVNEEQSEASQILGELNALKEKTG